jgi:cellobiose-specific phosphotransferase system component IIA
MKTKLSRSYTRNVARAREDVDLALTYWEDGALQTAARLLREAADRLEKAQQQKNWILRQTGARIVRIPIDSLMVSAPGRPNGKTK